MRLVVTAETDALDDWSFDADGNVESPGGRPVAEWLCGELSKLSATTGDVSNHENFGWSFETHSASGSVWCLIAGGAAKGSMSFWAKRKFSVWQFLTGRRERDDRHTLETVQELLDLDGRFQHVRIQAPGS